MKPVKWWFFECNAPISEIHPTVPLVEIVFGRQFWDSFPFLNRLEKFSNPGVRPMWNKTWQLKEKALRTRFAKIGETLDQGRPLYVGSRYLVQNQSGVNPKKWNRSGVVMKILPHNQFITRVDGWRRLTRRNRRFLRLYNPATTGIDSTSFLGSYKSLPSPYEVNIATRFEYCISLNNVGDYLYDTTTVEPISSHVEVQNVPVSMSRTMCHVLGALISLKTKQKHR